MQVTIDYREKGLARLLQDSGVPHQVSALPVGDVLCRYDSGASWIAERKRADDFAASIKDGRWKEQASRLFASASRVVYIFEGDFRETGMYPSLLGAWVNSELKRCYVFRTLDVQESAAVLCDLARKLEHPAAHAAPSSGLAPPLSKRKRQEDADVVFLRILMCVPSVSEPVARKLAEHFGSLVQLQEALRGTNKFPRIQLSEKTTLGKERIAKLSKYLL